MLIDVQPMEAEVLGNRKCLNEGSHRDTSTKIRHRPP